MVYEAIFIGVVAYARTEICKPWIIDFVISPIHQVIDFQKWGRYKSVRMVSRPFCWNEKEEEEIT